MRLLSPSDPVKIWREAKVLIWSLNKIYKVKKDEKIMDLMNRLTLIKRNVE